VSSGRIAGWGSRQRILKAADSHGTTLCNAQPRFAKDRDHLCEVDMAVAVKVRDDTLLSRRCSEVNRQQPASRLQHPPDLSRATASQLVRQMMQHQGTQDYIELPVTIWQRLYQCAPEIDFHTGFSRLPAGPCDHLRRSIDSAHRAFLTDLPFRRNRHRSGSATHIQNRLAGG
jgi:hypothetical protein